MKVIIINGPNLNLLGQREIDLYGSINFDDYLLKLKKKYSNFSIDYYQSNVEGEIINKLHEVGFSYDSIILNAGGYTHTSVAILDAMLAINTQVIEVHISNIYSREDFREKSILSKGASGLVVGFGLKSYDLALSSLVN